MNYTKSIIISIAAAIVVVCSAFAVYHPHNTIVQQETPPVRLGGTSPEFSSQYLMVNGVRQWYFSTPMKTASTTLCSIPYPAGTTTLEYATWVITSGTSTSATIDLATSTTAFSTTTNLVSGTSVASNAQGNIFYQVNSGANVAFGGNQTPLYVNVMTATPGLGGYTYSGTCQAVFDSL